MNRASGRSTASITPIVPLHANRSPARARTMKPATTSTKSASTTAAANAPIAPSTVTQTAPDASANGNTACAKRWLISAVIPRGVPAATAQMHVPLSSRKFGHCTRPIAAAHTQTRAPLSPAGLRVGPTRCHVAQTSTPS